MLTICRAEPAALHDGVQSWCMAAGCAAGIARGTATSSAIAPWAQQVPRRHPGMRRQTDRHVTLTGRRSGPGPTPGPLVGWQSRTHRPPAAAAPGPPQLSLAQCGQGLLPGRAQPRRRAGCGPSGRASSGGGTAVLLLVGCWAGPLLTWTGPLLTWTGLAHAQWMMINRLLRLLWPKLTEAILSEVVVQAKPILQELIQDVSPRG
jgi:hypothetical protein